MLKLNRVGSYVRFLPYVLGGLVVLGFVIYSVLLRADNNDDLKSVRPPSEVIAQFAEGMPKVGEPVAVAQKSHELIEIRKKDGYDIYLFRSKLNPNQKLDVLTKNKVIVALRYPIGIDAMLRMADIESLKYDVETWYSKNTSLQLLVAQENGAAFLYNHITDEVYEVIEFPKQSTQELLLILESFFDGEDEAEASVEPANEAFFPTTDHQLESFFITGEEEINEPVFDVESSGVAP